MVVGMRVFIVFSLSLGCSLLRQHGGRCPLLVSRWQTRPTLVWYLLPHGDSPFHGPSFRILVVDDDADLRRLISEFLAAMASRCRPPPIPAQMRQAIDAQHPDLVILDVMMPGEDGLSAARKLYAQHGPAVIMLSALGTDTDRIIGLEIGADDYLAKPCNPRELLARVRAVLRRRQAGETTAAGDSAVCEFAGWRLDATRRDLRDPSGTYIDLTDGEFALLRCFVDNPQRVLSRDQLLDPGAWRRARDLRPRRRQPGEPPAPQAQRTFAGGADPHHTQRRLHAAARGTAAVMRVLERLQRLSISTRSFLLVLAALVVAEGIGLTLFVAHPPLRNAPVSLSAVAELLRQPQDGPGPRSAGMSRGPAPPSHVRVESLAAVPATTRKLDARTSAQVLRELSAWLGVAAADLQVQVPVDRYLPALRAAYGEQRMLGEGSVVARKLTDGRWLVATSPVEAFPNAFQRQALALLAIASHCCCRWPGCSRARWPRRSAASRMPRAGWARTLPRHRCPAPVPRKCALRWMPSTPCRRASCGCCANARRCSPPSRMTCARR